MDQTMSVDVQKLLYPLWKWVVSVSVSYWVLFLFNIFQFLVYFLTIVLFWIKLMVVIEINWSVCKHLRWMRKCDRNIRQLIYEGDRSVCGGKSLVDRWSANGIKSNRRRVRPAIWPDGRGALRCNKKPKGRRTIWPNRIFRLAPARKRRTSPIDGTISIRLWAIHTAFDDSKLSFRW